MLRAAVGKGIHDLLLQYPFNMVTNLEGEREIHLLPKTSESKNSCNHDASFPDESMQDTSTSVLKELV